MDAGLNVEAAQRATGKCSGAQSAKAEVFAREQQDVCAIGEADRARAAQGRCKSANFIEEFCELR